MNETKPTASILIVEDEPDIRFVLQAFLESEGYPVAIAANGREALDFLERDVPSLGGKSQNQEPRPELILLDMRMPVMDGWEFCERLHRAALPHPRILVMTAAADAEKRAHEVHADAWIGKPFQLDELLTQVRKTLASPLIGQ